MVYFGLEWTNSWSQGPEFMLNFFGQEPCTVDANGRVKLTSRFFEDFERTGLSVVLYCLPEGGMGVYPVPVWEKTYPPQADAEFQAGQSMLYRREMRMRMAYAQPAEISNQGRLTIPPLFRKHLDMEPGTEVVLVGSGLCMEIWNRRRWDDESGTIDRHAVAKGEAEMAASLQQLHSKP